MGLAVAPKTAWIPHTVAFRLLLGWYHSSRLRPGRTQLSSGTAIGPVDWPSSSFTLQNRDVISFIWRFWEAT
ncbi:hypothetical protein BDN71DRAFT_268009 [Pleurotus eryngii]|uniref:Uncharacterized protein n=1 Tax=Pleurotus eryngii TaxID=5323 RepID=A0A9P6DIK0_PLEER|nr:hypothetical protein BDN71DRAFT_268009 [Pleurotus eryngii]